MYSSKNLLYRKLVRELFKSSVYLASRNVLFKSARRKGHKLGIIQQCGENVRSPDGLSYEQLGNVAYVIEANMDVARMKAWSLHKKIYKVEGSNIQTCETLSTTEQNNSGDSCRISVR